MDANNISRISAARHGTVDPLGCGARYVSCQNDSRRRNQELSAHRMPKRSLFNETHQVRVAAPWTGHMRPLQKASARQMRNRDLPQGGFAVP